MACKQVLKSITSRSMDQGPEVVNKTGTAIKGIVAPFLAKVDISTSDKAYRFQVALAGFSNNQSEYLILSHYSLSRFSRTSMHT